MIEISIAQLAELLAEGATVGHPALGKLTRVGLVDLPMPATGPYLRSVIMMSTPAPGEPRYFSCKYTVDPDVTVPHMLELEEVVPRHRTVTTYVRKETP